MEDKDTEIKIITDDEDSLKILGELLSNKTSRDLIKLLMNKSTYKKKIADELELPFSLVEHHLKKLEKLGLVKITNKKLVKGGMLHKNYKINADGIFITFNTKEEIQDNGILKRIFKDAIKFTSIGIAFLITSSISITKFKSNIINYPVPFGSQLQPDRSPHLEIWFYPLIILIICLIVERTLYGLKKRKSR